MYNNTTISHLHMISNKVSAQWADVTNKCADATRDLIARLERRGLVATRRCGRIGATLHNWVEVPVRAGTVWLDPTAAQFGLPNGVVLDRRPYRAVPVEWADLLGRYYSRDQLDKMFRWEPLIKAGVPALRYAGDGHREVRVTAAGNPSYYASVPVELAPGCAPQIRSVVFWESSPGTVTAAVCLQRRFVRVGDDGAVSDVVPCHREWWVHRHGVWLKKTRLLGEAGFLREDNLILHNLLQEAAAALGWSVRDYRVEDALRDEAAYAAAEAEDGELPF